MTDRPILFSGPMVRGLIRECEAPGTGKTQTRRLLRIDEHGRCVRGRHAAFLRDGIGFVWRPYGGSPEVPMPDDRVWEFVGYAPGDRLWVRESFAHVSNFPPAVRYYATDDVHELRRKRPGIHMPRWASRITLTVTDVRVQRVQEISEEDAKAEGVDKLVMEGDGEAFYLDDERGTYRCGFAGTWEHLNGKRAGASWDDNPWIVACTFCCELLNIDARSVETVEMPQHEHARRA